MDGEKGCQPIYFKWFSVLYWQDISRYHILIVAIEWYNSHITTRSWCISIVMAIAYQTHLITASPNLHRQDTVLPRSYHHSRFVKLHMAKVVALCKRKFQTHFCRFKWEVFHPLFFQVQTTTTIRGRHSHQNDVSFFSESNSNMINFLSIHLHVQLVIWAGIIKSAMQFNSASN